MSIQVRENDIRRFVVNGTGNPLATDKSLKDMIDDINTALTFNQQGDAALSQTNPVSTTLYTVLDTTANVRIISIVTNITWATTQPTPLDIVVTIDGLTYTFTKANPVSGTNYFADLVPNELASAQSLTSDHSGYRAFLVEGRSIKVQARVTWATTQPTPLVCKVRYAKR